MEKRKFTKATRVQIVYDDPMFMKKDEDGVQSHVEYRDLCKLLHQLQRENRTISNFTIRYEHMYKDIEMNFNDKLGHFPSKEEKEELLDGYTSMSGKIYSILTKKGFISNKSNMSGAIRLAEKHYKNHLKHILIGDESLPSYKNNMPIDIASQNIIITHEEVDNAEDGKRYTNRYFTISLLNKKDSDAAGYNKTAIRFKCVVKGKNAGSRSVLSIIDRCESMEYKLCGSKIQYDEQKKKWYLLLTYQHEKEVDLPEDVSEDNVIGVHIGVHNAIEAVYGHRPRGFAIEGGETEKYEEIMALRRREIGLLTKKGSLLCGPSRIGHGYKKKMQPLAKLGHRSSNFRDTVNKRYAAAIVKEALKAGAGTMNLEDLKDLAKEELLYESKLHNWSYYDLTNKIESKATEAGIVVHRIDFHKLHKYCPTCNALSVKKEYIRDEDDKIVGFTYQCTECGQIIDMDTTAAEQLKRKDISDILDGFTTEESK